MSDEIEIVSDSSSSGNTLDTVQDQEDFDIEIVGRPSKLTNETVRKLSSGLKLGLSQKKAADFAGISETTFYRWQREFQKIDKACLGNPERINNADDLNLWAVLKKSKNRGRAFPYSKYH